MQKLALPPPQSGMPFNAQLHESDIKRGYKVPDSFPRPPQPPSAQIYSTHTPADYKAQKDSYDEFVDVFARSKVIVTPPSDRELLDRIHKTIEYLLREGPVFEAIVIAREGKNPSYSFLYNNQSPEHVYYRWKLYSLLHGDNPYSWRTEEFRMFEGGPLWKPPPLNPYAEGMPQDLIDEAIADLENFRTSKTLKTPGIAFEKLALNARLKDDESQRVKGHLSTRQQEILSEILTSLVPTKVRVGSAMLFCINHADAADDIIQSIYKSLSESETPFQKMLARLFLISDILHNCSAAVTNASFYRKGFQATLMSIFKCLREYLVGLDDCYKSDRFKQKILTVLSAWKEWTLYEDEFLIQLSNILLGLQQQDQSSAESEKALAIEQLELARASTKLTNADTELDGAPVDDAEFASCLEAKGLSLRWYSALELSDNEDEVDGTYLGSNYRSEEHPLAGTQHQQSSKSDKQDLPELVRFKSSKWETVDPVEVIEQVVTMSKWNAMAQAEDKSPVSTTTGGSRSSGSSINGESPCDSSGGTRKKSRLMGSSSEEREK